jgi:hypothetical protein
VLERDQLFWENPGMKRICSTLPILLYFRLNKPLQTIVAGPLPLFHPRTHFTMETLWYHPLYCGERWKGNKTHGILPCNTLLGIRCYISVHGAADRYFLLYVRHVFYSLIFSTVAPYDFSEQSNTKCILLYRTGLSAVCRVWYESLCHFRNLKQ